MSVKRLQHMVCYVETIRVYVDRIVTLMGHLVVSYILN